MHTNVGESKVNRMIMKKQLIVSVMLVALTVVGVLNLDTVRVSAAEFPAIYISPALVTIEGCSEIGSNYTFSIRTDYNGSDICGYEFGLTYDPTVLEGVNVTNGDLITEYVNTTMWRPGAFNNTSGELGLTGNSFYYITPPPSLVQGPGILANVTFTVVGCGISNIDFVESETRLIGFKEEGGEWEEYNIIDEYFPGVGHMEGSVFDHSASHDVAIIDVSPNQTVVAQGSDVGINVTAQNQGQSLENFTVTAYYDTIVIKTENITNLAGFGTSTTLTFTWNTTGVPLGSYTISANASIVPSETDTSDNTYIYGTVTIGRRTVAITNVVNSRCGTTVNAAYKTWGVNVTVTVHNNCSLPLNCTVNAYYYNATVTQQIGTSQNVTNFDPGNYTTLTFVLDLSGDPVCETYTVKANATGLDVTSDEYVGGQMAIRTIGDVSGDGGCDGGDQIQVGNALWAEPFPGPGWERYNVYADVNGDYAIDGGDQITVGNHLWESCP